MGSTGVNAIKANSEVTQTNSQKMNIGYDTDRMRNIENIRMQGEDMVAAAAAMRSERLGVRTPNLKVGTFISSDPTTLELETFNAPTGTVLKVTNNEGDYAYHYTKSSDGTWKGTQKFSSDYVKPKDAKTPSSFGSKLGSMLIKVEKVGK